MSRFDTDDIRHYYDRHTPAFLSLGQGGSAGAIHRAVWGPGTATRLDAFHYVDDLVLDLVRSRLPDGSAPRHIVDLGCGVGASLCYLAERLPIHGTGVTLSSLQCRIATERVKDAGLATRVRCIEGDYTALPPDVETADLAYAIESFVHGHRPERFFAECHRLVRPGGLLAVCDDFKRSTTSGAASRTIDRFRRGWRINTLVHRDELVELADAAGFALESTTDLSPWLELNRIRDRVIALAASIVNGLCLGVQPIPGQRFSFSVNSRYGPFLGGSALQTCLARGWIGYDFIVFRRLDVGSAIPPPVSAHASACSGDG